MEQNVVLRLCEVFASKISCIKVVIGMCGEHFSVIKHPVFIDDRKSYIKCTLDTRTSKPVELFHSPFGEDRCMFANSLMSLTMFVLPVCSVGIFRWTIEIAFSKQQNLSVYIGISSLNAIRQCEEWFIGEPGESCSLGIGTLKDECLSEFRLCGVSGDLANRNPKIDIPPLKNYSVIAAEADVGAHTLSFFVNGKKVPQAISQIFSPFQFGISGYGNPCFTSLSLRRLRFPTPSPVHCLFLVCQDKTSSDNDACTIQ